MNDMREVFKWLDDHYKDMETALLELLEIDSTRGTQSLDRPFGDGPDKALKYVLDLAGKQGFPVSNTDGYMGVIQYPGKTKQKIGVLCHVDVVPASPDDWTFPPFSPVIHDGRIYGRGALDDKGPLIASQFALMALKECGYQPEKTIQHLIGTNEETGMGCIRYYCEHCMDLPEKGFAPDAFFPVILGEKGLLRWTCSAEWKDNAKGGLKLIHFKGGTEINCVPAYAEAELTADNAGLDLLTEAFESLTPPLKNGLTVRIQDNRALIKAEGVSVHASLCENGDNAIAKVLQLIARLKLSPDGADRFIKCTAEMLSDPLTGKSLGIFMEDDYSRTTNLLSLIDVSGTRGSFSCDTRFPVTCDGDKIISTLSRKADDNWLSFDLWERMDPLFYSKEDPLIKTLMTVYQEQTGDYSEPVITGAGTYARKIPGFAAFGPVFPNEENIAHQADERISIENFKRLAKIYAAAMTRLAG